jgi:hypothetical protein
LAVPVVIQERMPNTPTTPKSRISCLFGFIIVLRVRCGLTVIEQLAIHGRLLQSSCYHVFRKTHLRISVTDLQRNKNLKIQLARVPCTRNRQFWVMMNSQRWPKAGWPASLTRLFAALRKSLVKSVHG